MVKGSNKVSSELLIKVYEKKGGNVSATCTAVGISRNNFYQRLKQSVEFAERIREIDESLIDIAESMLWHHIKNGDITSLIFYLKTKGKKRGYVERVENEVSINPFEEIMMSVKD